MFPEVSIGIPFFNPGHAFRVSIKSVLEQSFTNFELILLDDGSTDGSLDIARSFEDSRITVISDGQNLGLPARLNQLIDLSKGEFIARMDADDFISRFKLEKQINFLKRNKEYDLVSTGICSVDSRNRVVGYRMPPNIQIKLNTLDVINGKVEIAHATILARRKWYLRNKYNVNAKLMEDYQLWIDSSLKDDLKVGFISEVLYFYREDNSISYKKLISAYKNQLNLILYSYDEQLPVLFKLYFYTKVKFKIFVTYILKVTKSMDLLFKIRNRKTKQEDIKQHSLQAEVDSFMLNFKNETN